MCYLMLPNVPRLYAGRGFTFIVLLKTNICSIRKFVNRKTGLVLFIGYGVVGSYFIYSTLEYNSTKSDAKSGFLMFLLMFNINSFIFIFNQSNFSLTSLFSLS